jgi:hypothetical protein
MNMMQEVGLVATSIEGGWRPAPHHGPSRGVGEALEQRLVAHGSQIHGGGHKQAVAGLFGSRP